MIKGRLIPLLVSISILLSNQIILAADGISLPFTYGKEQAKQIQELAPQKTGGASKIQEITQEVPPTVTEKVKPFEKISEDEISKTEAVSKKEITKLPEKEKPTIAIEEQPKTKQPYSQFISLGSLILKMLKGLFIALVALLALVLLFLFFRWIKTRQEHLDEANEGEAEHKEGEPATVSEAVSSFVRHRLKR